MTADQTTLLPEPPKLSPQQHLVYDQLLKAGADGLEPSEAGAWAHSIMESRYQHPETERCIYCPQRGNQILRRLRTLGLAKYRRGRGIWQAVGAAEAVPSTTQADGWDSLLEAGF